MSESIGSCRQAPAIADDAFPPTRAGAEQTTVMTASGRNPDTVPVTARASLRPWSLAAVGLGHGLALCAWLTGHGGGALAVLMASHALVLWGTLHPHSRLFAPVLRRLPVNGRQVWLTIDDGPSDDTPALLDLLRAHGARATFFLVAGRAAARPELVAQIVAGGHQIGNHTDSHPAAGFWLPRPWATRRQIAHAQTRLTALAGAPPRWFRAVAGHANPFVQPALARLGLERASWSGRGFDAVDADDERVLARLRRAIAPGAILLLHEGSVPGRAPRLLAALLAELAQRGYSTVLPEPPAPQMPAPLPPLAGLSGLATRALAPGQALARGHAPGSVPAPASSSASSAHRSPASGAAVSPAAPCPDSGSGPDRTPA